MEKFIFIKGKNSELSSLELASYLDSRNLDYSIVEDSENFTVIETEEIDKGMIKQLGGILKIAKVVNESNKIDSKSLEGLEKMIGGKVFGLSVYSEKDEQNIYKIVGNQLKKRLKSLGINAKYFGFASNRRPRMTNVEVIKKRLVEESVEIVVCVSKKFYIGTTQALHNPFEYQKRDMERPVQRPIFSIPPRLANIMINLAGAKEDDILLDPFCGIGTILQEAALRKIKIRGIDKDEICIESAKQNLLWLAKEYKLQLDLEKIRHGDATRIGEYFDGNSIDAIATEPYLGPPLKGNQSQEDVKAIFEEIRPLYEKTLKEMYKVLKKGKRAAIVSPCIRTRGNRTVKFDFKELAERAGFKIINSVTDAEKRHRTIREIFVIEK